MYGPIILLINIYQLSLSQRLTVEGGLKCSNMTRFSIHPRPASCTTPCVVLMGDKLKFELGTDAINARLEADLDPDLPVVGGKKLKARARFTVKTDNGVPSLVLEDLTVWGVSLPNDWLAQLKGKDLLGEILGGGKGGQVAGIEEMKVEPGQLKIRLKD